MSYKQLFIAEKPSAGKEIASHLSNKLKLPMTNGRGFVSIGDDIAITWLAGHLYEQVMPEYYEKNQGNTSHPCIPRQWHIQPKDDRARAQIRVIQDLIKQSKQLINFGDPDREGQLLVDELLIEARVNPDDERVRRLWLSAFDPRSIDEALANIKSNTNVRGHRLSALLRQRSDWLIGINGSTSLQNNCGVRKGVSMGRVQTPVLGMVNQRCEEIANFKSVQFYVPTVTMSDGTVLKWKHNGEPHPGIDDEGRIISKELAQQIMDRVQRSQWEVQNAQESERLVSPPLPHSLDSLQSMFGKRKVKASAVLEALQNMYSPEGGMKILSYPRVDTRYLPSTMIDKRQSIISGIAHLFEKQLKGVDLSIKGKAYNDKKVTAHHAIIPTGQAVPMSRLSPLEKDIYQEVTRCYIAQMHPDAKYSDFDLAVTFEKDLFTAKTSVLLSPGWMSTCGLAGSEQSAEGSVVKDLKNQSQSPKNNSNY